LRRAHRRGCAPRQARWAASKPPFDTVELALAASATYVARTTTFDFDDMPQLIRAALAHPGFALIEILT